MIRIIAGSTCNLSQDVIEMYNIKIAPFTITINNKKLQDNIDITSEEFYKQLDIMDEIPPTNAPTSSVYYKAFTEGVMNGVEEFIVITMSSFFASSYKSALKAQKMFLENNNIPTVRIAVIDSRNMSTGYGSLVLKIAMLQKSGVGFDDIVKFTEKYKTRTNTIYSIRDTVLLAKNGMMKNVNKLKRLSDVEVIIGTDKNKGVGTVLGQAKSHMEVLEYFTETFKKQADSLLTDFIIIGYTSDLQYANDLREYLFKNTDFKKDIHITQLSPTVGANIGLSAISMSYVNKSLSDAFFDLFYKGTPVSNVAIKEKS